MKRLIALAVLVTSSASIAFADEKDLNGTWVATSALQDGEKVPDDFVNAATIVFADGKYTATLGEIVENGTYTVGRSKKPNTMDMISSDKKKKSKPALAIFEVNGDTLTFCSSPATMRRPTDFTSTPDNKHFVVIYKRKK